VRRPHPITVASGSRWPLRDGRTVNSFHDWGVTPDGLTDDWRVTALAPDGTVEAIEHVTEPIAAVMWHPERDPRDDSDLALLHALLEAS
jgi:putative glutamine amidotransferase